VPIWASPFPLTVVTGAGPAAVQESTTSKKAIGRKSQSPVPPPVPSARDITGWITRPVDKLTDEHRAELERLCGLCPDLAAIRDLVRGFTDLVRIRGGDRLAAWVEHAEHGTIAEIRSFACGLRKDWDAVKAGLTMVWSSGAAEGAVNRIILWNQKSQTEGPSLGCLTLAVWPAVNGNA
jgi:hypothetical protein